MDLAVSTKIDRPPDVVFRFCAVDHLRNHPRWDPKMQLEQRTNGPVGVGTVFARRHTRVDVPIEGTMAVDEFVPDQSFGVEIRDVTPGGPLVVHSRMTMEPDAGGTRLTIHLSIPGMDASMDPSMVEASLGRIKELIEAET
jgi:hypothetical protein